MASAEASLANDCNIAYLRNPDESQSPICVYDSKEDTVISHSILTDGFWEKANVQRVWMLMEDNASMEFLDLGCNIGVFTIPIAKLGRRVTSVDANKVNLQMLSTSLRYGRLGDNVTLIWNGISNETSYVNLKQVDDNVGGTRIIKSSKGEPKDTENSIITIKLDEIVNMFGDNPVFMKIDIEGYEGLALKGAFSFFKEVDVRYILMEWMHHTNESGKYILYYLYERSFRPHKVFDMTELQIKDAFTNWPGDILWVKL
ncbi:uncharacterized protein LOC128204656 [Mya arenaria]|uniref:uncharacterized protein LOC128204644 n=1 Tax=Mya arenaria TaxID=6604 RepID=UPI0022DFE3F5|nr:uncharacterized protein LOC128204644 [Mya arenaria]XP_052762016.1 uncharacterized protein LOC128204656 [Mya arenaria]